MNEIVKHQPQETAISEQVRYAELVTQGDMIPHAYRNKPANALIAIGLGQAMGLSPAESLYRIDVIQGKPTAAAELIASNVRKAGHLLRVRGDDTSCTAQIVRNDDPEYTFEVTRDMEWAQRMGLNSKDNYKKQPGTMLQWRAVTAVARLACPEALYGVAYTPDEMSDLGERPRPPVPAESHTTASRFADAGPVDTAEPDEIIPTAESEIPAEVRTNAARAKTDGNLDQYAAHLTDRGAPAHIIDYVKNL